MESTPTEIAFEILDECRARIQANMAAHYRSSFGERSVNATGRSSAAFKVVVDDTGYRISLVYQGDDVAPLDSIEHGSSDAPNPSDLQAWAKVKLGRGLTDKQAERMSERIADIGTERHREPQEWIVSEPVKDAVEELNRVIPKEAYKYVKELIFS